VPQLPSLRVETWSSCCVCDGSGHTAGALGRDAGVAKAPIPGAADI
jgi:hypothetical protein